MNQKIKKIILLFLALAATVSFCSCRVSDNFGDGGYEPSVPVSPIPPSSIKDGDKNGVPDDGDSGNQDNGDKTPDNSGSNPFTPPAPAEVRISFLAAGDNIIHSSIYNDANEKLGGAKDKYDFNYIYEHIAPLVKAADLAYVNVETLIGGDSNGITGYPNFNAPEAAGEALLNLGFNVFNLAHNHMLDAAGAGKKSSLYLENCHRYFLDRGGLPLGYYKDKDDTENIPIIEVKGVKIAFLAYTYSTNGHKVGANDTTYIPLTTDEAIIKKQMAIAKEAADVVMVSMHWGVEDNWGATDAVFKVDDNQKKLAKLLASCNADVVIGMHPHVIQSTEWLERADGKQMLVTYSIGNLLSGMYWGRNMLGALLQLDIVVKDGDVSIEKPLMIPIVDQYKRISGEKFRDFKIYLFENYTESLATSHGCHAKDDEIASRGMKFSMKALAKKIRNTYSEEFLSESVIEMLSTYK